MICERVTKIVFKCKLLYIFHWECYVLCTIPDPVVIKAMCDKSIVCLVIKTQWHLMFVQNLLSNLDIFSIIELFTTKDLDCPNNS